MNRVKVGRFIGECRKNKGMTQARLAEALGTTDKSVSKWENGICLPEPSLYEPLCNALGISIGELFAGQRMESGDDKRSASDNLLKLLMRSLYESSDKSITFDEFSNALNRMSEAVMLLNSFNTKDEAVDYLAEKTGLPKEECSDAYGFYKGGKNRMGISCEL